MKIGTYLLMLVLVARGAYGITTDIWDAIAKRVLKDKEDKE